MILHIPHASTYIPDWASLTKDDLSVELECLTDWDTDTLFEHPSAERVVFGVSRLVCDVERLMVNEPMETIGKGICYITGVDGDIINVVTDAYRDRVITELYHPHHRKLNSTVATVLTLLDRVVVVDCHSFSGIPLPFENDNARPDICLGINDIHDPSLLSQMTELIESSGYNVMINRPYAGAMVPSEYTDDERVTSIMIEVNRDLYRGPSGDWKAAKLLVDSLLNIVNDYEVGINEDFRNNRGFP